MICHHNLTKIDKGSPNKDPRQTWCQSEQQFLPRSDFKICWKKNNKKIKIWFFNTIWSLQIMQRCLYMWNGKPDSNWGIDELDTRYWSLLFFAVKLTSWENTPVFYFNSTNLNCMMLICHYCINSCDIIY